MARKRNTKREPKGWYCFSRDLLSSQRYRRCAWATKGVYFDTLNVLSLQTKPGALCLKDFDLYPKKERSLTQRCLACQRRSKNGEYQSIKYFAEAIAVSASGPRPGLIHGLQELYLRGIIVIEGDTLIQPRMYRDNGFDMSDLGEYMGELDENSVMIVAGSPDDGEADHDAERMRLGDEKNTDTINNNNGTQKTTKNNTKKPRVGAGDAPAQSKRGRVGVRDNNINDNGIDSKDNAINTKAKGEKTAPRKMSPVADNPPTLDEVCAYFAERESQGKPLLYITAEEFYATCETDGWTRGKDRKPIMNWKTYAITCNQWRQNHGDQPVSERRKPKQGEAVPATCPKEGKYKKW